jgi:hypothetical protein
MNRCRRTIFLVDRDVQGALLIRVVCYWLFCLLGIVLMVICWNVYTGPPRRFVELALDLLHRYGPALVASLILLPIVMMDVVRLSNRFVGPVLRLRTALQKVADGRPLQPLNFRDHDFWQGLADDFNRAATRLAHSNSASCRPTEEMPHVTNEDIATECEPEADFELEASTAATRA